MYPFRFLYHLKKKVGNKARVEGSICNAYLMEEISNFCSLYFENDVDTKASDLGLNVGQQHINVDASLLEIFSCNLGNVSVKGVHCYINEKDYNVAHRYVLNNCGLHGEYEWYFSNSF